MDLIQHSEQTRRIGTVGPALKGLVIGTVIAATVLASSLAIGWMSRPQTSLSTAVNPLVAPAAVEFRQGEHAP